MDSRQTHAIARTALKNSPVFCRLPEEVIDRMAAVAEYEFHRQSTLVFESGKHADHLRYVVAGHVVARAHAGSGDETELLPYGIGSWMTWLGTFGAGEMVQDYWSSENAAYLAFPSSKVRELTQSYPTIYPPMLNEIGARFRVALQWIWNSNLAKSEQRICRHLILLSEQFGSTEIPLSQDSLARTLGYSRQTLSRLLRDLEKRGLIEISYRCLKIDRGSLAKMADRTDEPAIVR